ncbi:MAG: hypothetical protein ACLP7Q_25615 [Isosphaeraceae bacterium]
MNSRPLRTRQLRKRAWALAAALLSATECWALDGPDASAPHTRTGDAVSATSSTKSTNRETSRPRIPPPRKYRASDFAAQATLNAQRQPQSLPAKRLATEPGDQQPLFAPARITDGGGSAVPLFAPAAANLPVASGAVGVSQSAAEKPAGAAVPASGPVPSTASIAPPPRSSATLVDAPAAADTPPVGQIRQQVDAPVAADAPPVGPIRQQVDAPAAADAPSVGQIRQQVDAPASPDAPAVEQNHKPVQAGAAADLWPVDQSHEKADVTTTAVAPELSEHTSPPKVFTAPAKVPSPSESPAYCEAPASINLSSPDVNPSASAEPLKPAELPAPADLPAPAGMTSAGQSPLPADRPQSAQQAVETLTQALAVSPSQASGSAPSPGVSLSRSTGSAAEKTSTAGHGATPASRPEVPLRPETLTAGLLDAAKVATPVPLAVAFATSGVIPAVSQAVTLPASSALLVAAQSGKSDSPAAGVSDPTAAKSKDRQVQRTHCSTCGGFHSTMDGPAPTGCLTCGGPNCVPGQKPCCPPANECNTVLGAFCVNLYQEICCPDPCYQPHWEPAAFASFFADYARPRTVTRIRYDNLENMTRPDRNQFWINQVKYGYSGNRKIASILPLARLQQVYLYQEAAAERASFFVEIPYRQINQNYAPTQAGFSDLNFGSKALLFDSELLLITFQFRTFMPTGNFTNNLGNGQFALDPSLLTSLKLGPETYFQGQFGNWIPLGGPGVNRQLAGGIFYWLMSLNQVLCYFTPDSPLIGTLEMDGWSFEDGQYTAKLVNGNGVFHEKGGGVSYFNIGPGLRQSICNRLDFGGAITFASNSGAHWAEPWFRFELRILF